MFKLIVLRIKNGVKYFTQSKFLIEDEFKENNTNNTAPWP